MTGSKTITVGNRFMKGNKVFHPVQFFMLGIGGRSHVAGAIFFLVFVSLVLAANAYASDSSRMDLFNMSLDELLDVEVVTASRQPESLTRSISTTYVVTGDELRAMGARTIYDALIQVPGLTFGRNRGGSNKVILRGSGSEYSSQIIFMIDNHVINDPISGGIGSFTDAVGVDNIDRIEVVQGPVSSLYGANAFLGIINIITLKGEDIEGAQGRFRTEFDKSGHVYNYYNVLMGKYFESGWQAALNLYSVNGDGPELYVRKDFFGRSGYADDSQELYNASWRIENDSFSLKGHYSHRNGGGNFGIGNVINENSNLENEYLYLDALYTFSPLEDLDVSLRAGFDYMMLDAFYDMYPKGSIPSWFSLSGWNSTGYKTHIKAKEYEYSLNLSSTWDGLDDHTMTLGLSYRYQGLTDPKTYVNSIYISTGSGLVPVPSADMHDISDFLNWIESASRNNYAAYIQDIWEVTDKLNFSISGRYDYYTDFGSTFNPKVGFNYEIADGYQVHALYGRAFRAPDFGSLYIQNNPLISGNKKLDPEHINSVEAGVRASVTDALFIEAVYFYNDMKDLIDLDDNSPRFYQNNSNVKVNGIEFSARYEWEEMLKFRASYSWKDLDADSDYSTITVPAHSGSLEMNWLLTDTLNWNINLYVQGKSPRMHNDSRDDLDGYALLNSTLTYKPFSFAEFQASVFNIADDDYAYPAQADTIPGDYTAPGRSVVLGLRLIY